MFSIPPATAVSTVPDMISWDAEMIACAPEPQTRFTVIPGTETGNPAWITAWRAGFIGAGLNNIAHNDGSDLLGIEAGACDSGFYDDRAKIGRRNFFQAAAKGTDRGSHWRDNDDRIVRH